MLCFAGSSFVATVIILCATLLYARNYLIYYKHILNVKLNEVFSCFAFLLARILIAINVASNTECINLWLFFMTRD